MKKINFLVGILAGIAAGALVGVLVAPNKGSRTRRMLMRDGKNYSTGIKDKFEDLINSLNDNYEDGSQEAKSLLAEARNKYEFAKRKAKNATN